MFRSRPDLSLVTGAGADRWHQRSAVLDTHCAVMRGMSLPRWAPAQCSALPTSMPCDASKSLPTGLQLSSRTLMSRTRNPTRSIAGVVSSITARSAVVGPGVVTRTRSRYWTAPSTTAIRLSVTCAWTRCVRVVSPTSIASSSPLMPGTRLITSSSELFAASTSIARRVRSKPAAGGTTETRRWLRRPYLLSAPNQISFTAALRRPRGSSRRKASAVSERSSPFGNPRRTAAVALRDPSSSGRGKMRCSRECLACALDHESVSIHRVVPLRRLFHNDVVSAFRLR